MPDYKREISSVLESLPVSGTYVTDSPGEGFVGAVSEFETLRLDVDGTFPQKMASGTYTRGFITVNSPVYWIAYPMHEVSYGVWEGYIAGVWGNASLIPHSKISIHVSPNSMYAYQPKMTVTFSGGPPDVTRVLVYYSPWFREVTFEFDTVLDSPHVTSIDTWAHLNRPATLPHESLTFDKVYDRAGVDVSKSPKRSTVPLSLAGADSAWDDMELEDAMHKYWSMYSDGPNWAVWVLFAATYVDPGIFGTMFDDSDQNQRQGCAVFNQTLDGYVPPTYPQRAEHLARMRFFDLVHETGHCFNLHHAWRAYNPELNWPFFPLISDYATFMNYPEKVFDFFGKFEYRFHDSELKFLRHAPDNFVEMGDAKFYGGTDRFFGVANNTAPRPWKLEISLHRRNGVFEFLEPVNLTATLTNTSEHPQIIDASVLEDGGNFALVIARVDGRVRFWRPFVQRCFLPRPRVLEAGQSLSASFFISAGLGGWYLSEPGAYVLQAALQMPSSILASSSVRVRISHPCSFEEDAVAQDFFTRDVAVALAFGATPSRTGAVQTLRDVVERLPERTASRYAALALAQGSMRDVRVLRTGAEKERGFDVMPADHGEASKLFERALSGDPGAATASLGVEGYRKWSDRYAVYQKTRGGADSHDRHPRKKR